ncbi:MAG: DUF1573 domain-containing protein [Desulfobacterales bacterium]|nr:MAG: DUF1573 domain-containing protein [Desulfobacterales bacterium]
MNHKSLYAFMFALCFLFFTNTSSATENSALNSPSAFFPESRFEFKPVVDGADVTHSFVVKNKGASPLKIEKVRTG